MIGWIGRRYTNDKIPPCQLDLSKGTIIWQLPFVPLHKLSTSAWRSCRLPPLYATFVCHEETLDFTSLQEYTTVVLEATTPSSRSYHALLENAVSMLSKQDKRIILSPSIVANMVLALSWLAPSAGVQPTRSVGCLCTSQDVRQLLQAAELRLLLLDGDVYAWYTPEQQYLHLAGAGCAVIFTKNAAAGTLPAPVEIDVLTPDGGHHW